jgi:hypothetical protein
MVSFVFTNPRHHLDAMAPVARALQAQGIPTQLISLAELRGFRTPKGLGVVRAVPAFRRGPSVGKSMGMSSSAGMSPAQMTLWHGLLRPRLRWLLRGSRAVVVPNDAAWPYGPLCSSLTRRDRPFVLLQEGIRFPLPGEASRGSAYGAAGAAAICVWGEASAEHFRAVAPSDSVQVTGTPRFDTLQPQVHVDAGKRLLDRLGLKGPALLFLSNPIDDMGFCSTSEKMSMFLDFLDMAVPVLASESRGIIVKLHPSEDLAAFRDLAAGFEGVHVVDAGLHEVLAAGLAAVVLASTVGLEAMMFGLPLGVLALPGHGHVFEYVERGGAVALSATAPRSLRALLETNGSTKIIDDFVERHVAHRGESALLVADVIRKVAG